MKFKIKFFEIAIGIAMLLPIVGQAQVMTKKMNPNAPDIALKQIEIDSISPKQDDQIEIGNYMTDKAMINVLFNSNLLGDRANDYASVVRCLDEKCVSTKPIFTEKVVNNNALNIYFPTTPPLGLYQATVKASTMDIGGLMLGNDFVWTFSIVSNGGVKASDPVGALPAAKSDGTIGDSKEPGVPASSSSDTSVNKNNLEGLTGNAGTEGGAAPNSGLQTAAMSGAGCSLSATETNEFHDFLIPVMFTAMMIFSLQRRIRKN